MTRRIPVVLAFVLLAACAGSRARPQPDAADGTAVTASGGLTDDHDRARVVQLIAARSSNADRGGYRVGADDLLEIRIPDLLDAPQAVAPSGAGGAIPMEGTPAFAQGLRVSAAGDVTLPYLGQVHVDGLTPPEIERTIARRLRERGLLTQPQVSVRVVEYRSRVVAVVGAVERPGVYPVTRPGATVSDLIWAAGGPTREAGRLAHLMPAAAPRNGAGEARAPIRLDLHSLLDGSADGHGPGAIPVRPGDVINLGPAGSVTVEGWVEKPGAYPVTRGLSLSGAVAAAGGALFPADRGHAQVQRVVTNGEQRLMTVDLDAVANGSQSDVIMTDGDVVRIPSSSVRLVPWGVWAVVKTLVRVGGDVLLF